VRENQKIVYAELPGTKADAISARVIEERLNVSMQVVTRALSSLYMDRHVGRVVALSPELVERKRRGTVKHVRTRKMHYWRIGAPL